MSKGHEYLGYVDLQELDMTVDYNFTAGASATHEDPGYGPEVEITAITLSFGEESFNLTAKSVGLEGVLFTMICDDEGLIENIVEDYENTAGDEG